MLESAGHGRRKIRISNIPRGQRCEVKGCEPATHLLYSATVEAPIARCALHVRYLLSTLIFKRFDVGLCHSLESIIHSSLDDTTMAAGNTSHSSRRPCPEGGCHFHPCSFSRQPQRNTGVNIPPSWRRFKSSPPSLWTSLRMKSSCGQG